MLEYMLSMRNILYYKEGLNSIHYNDKTSRFKLETRVRPLKSYYTQVGTSVRLVSSVHPFYFNLHAALYTQLLQSPLHKTGPDIRRTSRRYLCPLIKCIYINIKNNY